MIPLSGKVPGRASGPSRSRVDDDGGLQHVLWKDVSGDRVFATKGIYRWKGNVIGEPRGPHHRPVRPGGRPRHPMVRPPPSSPPSLLWTPSSCQVNRNWHCGILLIG
jgi:hypothetical protein